MTDPKTKLDTTGNGKIIFEFFPPEYIELNLEIMSDYHPKLQKILVQFPASDIDMKLAQTAAYCQIAMDGAYTLDDRIKLCKILRERLMLRRELPKSQIIILN